MLYCEQDSTGVRSVVGARGVDDYFVMEDRS